MTWVEVEERRRWVAHGKTNSRRVLGDERSDSQLRCSATLISDRACQRSFSQRGLPAKHKAWFTVFGL